MDYSYNRDLIKNKEKIHDKNDDKLDLHIANSDKTTKITTLN